MSESASNTVKRRGRPPRPAPAQVAKPSANDFLTIEGPNVVELRETAGSDRPSMRPSMREDDPRAAAARRAAEIRGHLGSMDEGTDDFRTPEAPSGWTYEWKRRTLLGQEDPAYQVQLSRTGWDPVPTHRHPEMMPIQGSHPTIERKGMVLMQRPAVISEEARVYERQKAQNQVRVKEQQLNATPDGTLTRDHPSARPQIKKGFEPIPVPKD